MLAEILIALVITELVFIADKLKEIKELKQDYNVLLGSYKQLGQVMVSADYLKQEEYNKHIASKQFKE